MSIISSSLYPLITKPTRIMDRSATLIDNILTDNILTNSLDDSNLRGILITDI